jgi:CBS domain containing-hemolysin-like protein
MSNNLSLFLLFFGLDLLVAAVRAAIVHARLPYLMVLREQHPESVDRAIQVLDQPRLRVSLRLAVVLVHFILAGLAWVLALELFPLASSAGLVVGLLFLAALVVLVLEFAIDGAILHQPEAWTLRFLRLGQLLDLLLSPVSLLMMRLLGRSAVLQNQLSMVTDEELKNWAETIQPEGSLEQGERKMIYSIFQFGDTLCREIMVPRIDVFGLDVSTSLTDAIDAFARSGHSRIPVFADSIDNILGILYAKDLLKVKLNPSGAEPIRKFLRPPYYVPESKKVDELLREMQERGVHMAIVVDEYGGTNGIITLEDIVEEIVGEIRDEYDQGEEQLYQQISPDEISFIGRIGLDDVNELLGTHLTTDVADTLGGYIYGKLGRVPNGGEELVQEDWTLVVEQVSGRRIRKVGARRKPAEQPVEEQGDDVERRDAE